MDLKPACESEPSFFRLLLLSVFIILILSSETFWKVIKEGKVHYTKRAFLHPCKICNEGPGWEKKLKSCSQSLEAEMKKDPLSEKVNELRKEQGRWGKLAAKIMIHREQFQVQRAAVQKIEKELKPGEVLVYKDFVNQHIHGGSESKCNNLVLVCTMLCYA